MEEEGSWILVPALPLGQLAVSSFCLHMTFRAYNQAHGSSLSATLAFTSSSRCSHPSQFMRMTEGVWL